MVPQSPHLSLPDMFKTVHGHRSLHHGAKRTYLALCRRYPGYGIPIHVIQDLVAEYPICLKDRLPQQLIPHPTAVEAILHHKRSIGIDHVSLSPIHEDGALLSYVVSELNTWLGIPHKVSLIGRHESNGTENVNALLLGHLRRLVHDERLVHQWSSDTVLPLIHHALATSPNTELGGISPAELQALLSSCPTSAR